MDSFSSTARRKLLSSGGIALALKVMAAGCGYALFVALARWMDVTEYGVFSVAFSAALFVGVLAALGTPGLLVRFLSEYDAKGQPDHSRSVIRVTYGAVLLSGTIAAIGFLIAAGVNGTAAFYGAALLAPAFAIAQMQTALFRSYDMVVLAIAPHDVIWRLCAFGGALAVLGYAGSLNAATAMMVCGGMLTAVVIIQAILGWKRMPPEAKQGPRQKDMPAWIKAGVPIWGAALCIRTTQHIAVILAGLTLTLTDAALFFAAMKTARLLSMPLDAGSVIGQPMLGRALHSDRPSDGQKICNILSLGVSAVSALGYIFLILAGAFVLGLFGEAYIPAYNAMLIIGIGVLFNAMSGPTGFIMISAGAERLNLLYLFISNAVGLIAVVVLGTLYGLEGAALGYAIGLIGWNVMVWLWSRRELGIDPTILAFVYPVRHAI